MQVLFTKNQRIFQLVVIQGRKKNAFVALDFDHKELHLGLNYHWVAGLEFNVKLFNRAVHFF
jgi:hypothetical protein